MAVKDNRQFIDTLEKTGDVVRTDIPMRVSFNEIYPEEVKDRVLTSWNKWGFK